MREDIQAILGILNFIIPFEVVTAVGLVFAAENIVEAYLETGAIPLVWVQIYLIIVLVMGAGRYLTATEEEIDDLEEDYDELSNGK